MIGTLSCIALAASLLVLPSVGHAQAWRGMGRVAGKVTDQDGKPIQGVAVKAYMPEAEGGTEVATNRRGDWVLAGIAGGLWHLDFSKPGYETRQITLPVSEHRRTPPIEIALERSAPVVDPNAEIRDGLMEAADLMNRRQHAEARRIYEGLLVKYPEAHQLHPLIARAYYAENEYDKSIEHLRLALEKDPDNVEVTLLLGNVLVEKGDAEEGRRILESIDESRVTEATTFLNLGIGMLNQNRPAEAVPWFDRAITRFPDDPDAYYYRGITRLQLGETEAAVADLEKFVAMAPEAPQTDTARKILEQIR